MVVTKNRVMDGLLALIPDAIIAWIAAAYTDRGATGFILIMLGLQCVYLLIWIKNSLWSWLVYRVYWRRKITDYLEDYLVQNHFPAPTQFVGVDEYLDQVANSEQNDCSTRVKAAMDLASLRNAYDVEIQFGIQLYLASEDALKRYARRFPLPARQDDEWDDD